LNSAWIAIRRPLLVAFVLGCSISLMTTGRLTLRIAGPATLSWSYIPILEIIALAAVCGRRLRAETIDLFFEGHRAWLLWVIAFAALFAFVPAPEVIARTGFPWIWYISAILVVLWSGYVDFGFSRRVLERTRFAALRDVVVQRLIVWSAVFVIFVWPAGVQVVASSLGL
jgi:hypothetical protein